MHAHRSSTVYGCHLSNASPIISASYAMLSFTMCSRKEVGGSEEEEEHIFNNVGDADLCTHGVGERLYLDGGKCQTPTDVL